MPGFQSTRPPEKCTPPSMRVTQSSRPEQSEGTPQFSFITGYEDRTLFICECLGCGPIFVPGDVRPDLPALTFTMRTSGSFPLTKGSFASARAQSATASTQAQCPPGAFLFGNSFYFARQDLGGWLDLDFARTIFTEQELNPSQQFVPPFTRTICNETPYSFAWGNVFSSVHVSICCDADTVNPKLLFAVSYFGRGAFFSWGSSDVSAFQGIGQREFTGSAVAIGELQRECVPAISGKTDCLFSTPRFRDEAYIPEDVTFSWTDAGVLVAGRLFPWVGNIEPKAPLVEGSVSFRRDDFCVSRQCDCDVSVAGMEVVFDGQSFTVGSPTSITVGNKTYLYDFLAPFPDTQKGLHRFLVQRTIDGVVVEESSVNMYCNIRGDWVADFEVICNVVENSIVRGSCVNRWLHDFFCNSEGRPIADISSETALIQFPTFPQCTGVGICEIQQRPTFKVIG